MFILKKNNNNNLVEWYVKLDKLKFAISKKKKKIQQVMKILFNQF